VKTQVGKNYKKGRERIHYCQKVTMKFTELYSGRGYDILDHIPLWFQENVYLY